MLADWIPPPASTKREGGKRKSPTIKGGYSDGEADIVAPRTRVPILSGDAAADGWRWGQERGSMMTKEEREGSQFYEWGLKSWTGRTRALDWIHCIKDQLELCICMMELGVGVGWPRSLSFLSF